MGIVGNIKGAKGDTGDAGQQGAVGTPGSVWYNGTGAASDATGVDGDYYLDVATGNVYVKAGGTWA